MIIYTKENGCYFERESTGKHYHLYEMETYKGNTTSDIIAIWDHDNDCLVNHLYGANLISVEDLDRDVSAYVEEYERKKRAEAVQISVQYKFTEDGVKRFMKNAYDNIFEAMDNCNPMTDDYGDHDIYIRIGCHEIRIPDVAYAYQAMEDYLKDVVEDYYQ